MRIPNTVACLAAAIIPSWSLGATPQYQGRVCPADGGARIEVEVDSSIDAILVYPMPSGGGWYMTEEAPGLFVHVAQGVEPGGGLSFSLILQGPQQYQFPEHQMTLASECVDFERDDVLAPPPRGFRQDVVVRDGMPWFTFHAGMADHFVDETTEVTATYRLDGDLLTTIVLSNLGDGRFETPVAGAEPGQRIEYWFSQQMGIQQMHSALIERTIGEPAPEFQWPVVSRRVGRFRDRHPNEWRFDNYVQEYGQGRTFEIELTDWGNRIDVRVTVAGDIDVADMDFKRFVYNDPYSESCNRPLTGVNLVMEKDGDAFVSSIEDTSPHATIDFDFTFRGIPTGPVGQYYSDFFYYRTGVGLFGPEHPNPRRTPVGNAVATRVYSPRFGFAQHAGTMSHDELKEFLGGKIFFETDYANGALLNFGTRFDCCSGPLGEIAQSSPVHQSGVLGPRFNSSSCITCHAMDGRGATPMEGVDLHQLVAHVSVPGTDSVGAPLPHPYYGSQLGTGGDSPEGRLRVRYEDVQGQFDDGTPWTMRRPVYDFQDMESGSLGINLPDVDGSPGWNDEAEFSPRIAPMLAGLGFLEAVADETILAMEDADDADGDGISGRVNRVWDEASGTTVPGRFGWKSNQPSLRQQVASAFVQDLGITSPLYPVEDCGDLQDDCDPGSSPELGGSDVIAVEHYLQGLTLPPRRNFDDPQAIAGMHLFKAANCQACHVPKLQTGTTHPIAAYRDISIEPFTDLLLHDMGPELADGRPHFDASGSEWRTPPLWGLSYVGHVLGLPDTCEDPESGGATPNFLHDGRARSLMEAILWHGGEAESSRNVVLGMTATEREQLLAYVAYPFDDPIFREGDSEPVCPQDLDGSGRVDVADLLLLIASWGQPGPADFDGSGTVGVDDLLVILALWGTEC